MGFVLFCFVCFVCLSFSELFSSSGSCGKPIAMSVILGNANYAQCHTIDYCPMDFFFASFVSICKFSSDS